MMLDVNVIGQQLPRSEYWFVPDLVLIALLAFGMVGGRSLLMEQLRSQVNEVDSQTAKLNDAIGQIEAEIAGAEQAAAKLMDLESRHQVLLGLKDQQVIRYRPIIVMELLQQAKPAGLWFEAIELVRAPAQPAVKDASNRVQEAYPRQIRITGRSISQKLVGDYAAALAATAQKPASRHDPRSQIYFDRINLLNLERRDPPAPTFENEDSSGEVVSPFFQFSLELNILERMAPNEL